MSWYTKVTSDDPKGGYNALGDALIWFEKKYEEGREELKPAGKIETLALKIPGLVEYYYGILQDIEAIHEWLVLQETKTKGEVRKKYIEHYNRELSASTAEKYVESDPEVIDIRMLRITVDYTRNRFLGLHAGFNALHFNIGHCVRLRVAGIEDAMI